MFPTFDDVVAGLEAEFPAIHETYALSTGAPDLADVRGAEFILAGWSTQRAQAEGYFIKAGAGKLTGIEAVFAAPWPQRFEPVVEVTEATVEVTVLSMMEAQRAEHPDRIGGFAQMTTVSAEGIRHRMVRRWKAPPRKDPVTGSCRAVMMSMVHSGRRRSCYLAPDLIRNLRGTAAAFR
jgi:hypothetical protein